MTANIVFFQGFKANFASSLMSETPISLKNMSYFLKSVNK